MVRGAWFKLPSATLQEWPQRALLNHVAYVVYVQFLVLLDEIPSLTKQKTAPCSTAEASWHVSGVG